MKFLINMMFSRLNKLDGPIFEGVYIRGGGEGGGGGLIFGMLIGLDISEAFIRRKHINGILLYI